MKLATRIVMFIALVCLTTTGLQLAATRTPQSGPPPSGHSTIIHVKGGRLEVSRIERVETFERTTEERLFGITISKTTVRIKVPAIYRYYVDLAPDWTIELRDKTFIVISPPVRASLPVAIDTGRLEVASTGRWSFVTGRSRADELQRSITNSLAAEASSPAMIRLQREVARQTLKEFVVKWLITQERWKASTSTNIRVLFANESKTGSAD